MTCAGPASGAEGAARARPSRSRPGSACPDGARFSKRWARAWSGAIGAALFVAALPLAPSAQAAPCREDQVDLRGPDGSARFVVEIADDPDERAKGLMFREEMAASHGMLFLFDPPQPVAFWMRNTPLPLDLVFLDAAGRVLNVIANATPFSEDHLPSEGETRAVLEINGGLAAHYGIGKGAVARHPGFGPAADWPC